MNALQGEIAQARLEMPDTPTTPHQAFCSRDEHAGPKNRFDPGSSCYIHIARGPCACGVEHAPASPKSAPGRGKFGDVDQVYKYHGPDGAVLFEVMRFKNPKDFRQRRPRKGAGGKDLWGLGTVKPVLYKLPLLMKSKSGDTVWIVEGERGDPGGRSRRVRRS
jgi:hypothetical protein